MRRFINGGVQVVEIDVTNEVNKYRQFLEMTLDDLNALTPGHNDIPHDKLIKRQFEIRKPFSKKGTGYRDALIWEILLTTASDNDNSIAFITNNWKDFSGEESDELHAHLLNDLEGRAIPHPNSG